MSKPSKRDLLRQERLEQLRKETAQAKDDSGSPPSPASKTAEAMAAGRAKGAGVTRIISSLSGGVMGELKEARQELEQTTAKLEEAEALNQELRLRMESLAQGGDDKAELLDTELVRVTAWDNRDPKSFDDDDRDFRALKEDIEAHQGNKIPGLVRPLDKPEGKVLYEVVYGNRRLVACQRLGLKFKAFIQTISDEEAMLLQHVENAHRKNLSTIETALKVESFLKHRRTDSGRAKRGSMDLLVGTLKLQKKHVGKLALIGQIPEKILNAIPDIREVPFRPAFQLARLVRDSEDEVLARLASVDKSWKSRQVVNHLIGKSHTAAKQDQKESKSAPQTIRFEMPAKKKDQEAFQKELKALADRFGIKFERLEQGSGTPS